MEDNYVRTMLRNENLCQEYLRKAEDERIANGGQYNREACAMLQAAAFRCSEMANMSTGEERLYYQRRLQELNRKIEDAARRLNPDAFRRYAEKKAGGTLQKNSDSQSVGEKKTSAPSSQQAEKSEETSQWLKETPRHSFADVSGMAALKEQLQECVTDVKVSRLKSYLKMKNLHSFFFIGPPGCGKTYVIEAFAHELMGKNYKYLSLVGSDILSKYVGEAEKIVNGLFEAAEANEPCIVFIDEIDGVCKNRSLPNLPNYAASLTTAFLTGYNRINSSDKKIVFIGATNYPEQVDNAMLDRVELIRVPLPDAEARQYSLEHHFDNMIQMAEDISSGDMARETEKYNYRDLERLCNRMKEMVVKAVMKEYGNEDDAVEALKTGRFCITRDIFEAAKRECLPTPKDDILKALDEWEARYKKGMEE
ncbi:MAG: ATP-binding protein [Eubacteriales bacterium]|nr:ATP-binding protein [Eubacteriales bacterium]